MARRLALIAVLLAVGVPLLAETLVRRIAVDRLRPLVEEDLAEVLGLGVSVEKLAVSVIPTPHLEATHVRVDNLPGRRLPHLLEVAELEIGLALLPLLRRQLVVDALELRGVVLEIETDAEGDFALPIALPELVDEQEGPGDPLDLQVLSLRLEDVEAFQVDGATGSVRSLQLALLAIEADGLRGPLELTATGALDGTAFELEARGGPLGELLEPSEPYPLEAAGRVFDAEVELEGSVARPQELAGFDLGVTVRLLDLALSGWPLPDLGPITVMARLSDLDGSLGLENLALETGRSDPIDVTVAGAVDDLTQFREVAVTGEVEARDLEFLEELVELPLPEIGEATLQASLSDDDGSLGLAGELHASTPDDAVRIDVEGGLDDIARIKEFDVAVAARARDLPAVAALLEGAPELPRLGPVSVEGRLRDREGAIGIDGLRAEVGRREATWMEITGTVDDLLGQRGIALVVRFGARDLAFLEPVLERSLPPIGPLRGEARITDADGTLGIEDLRVDASGSGAVRLSISAGFDDLLRRDEVALSAQLSARDLASLGQLAGLELPPIGPVEFAGRLRGSDEALSAEGVTLRLGETRLEGRASGSFREDERPSLRATIESPHVRLADIGLAPDEDVPSSEEEEAPALPPFEELRAIDLDLELRADRITGRAGLDLRDAHATVRLHDGELLLGDVGAVYELGHVGGELRVDASTPEPHLAVELEAEAIDLGRVMSQVESDTDFSGLVDLHVSLRSEGRTPEEILVALEGDTRLVLRDGTTATTYARMFVVNLAHVAFPLLRPRRDTQIGCAVMAFELESGVARVATLVLDGGEITVTGSGEIDLVRGVYDLELVPSTTNPGVMSMAPRVQVVGPLGQPQFRPVKRTLASSMGRGLLANVRKAGGRLLRPLRSRDDTLESAEITCADVGR